MRACASVPGSSDTPAVSAQWCPVCHVHAENTTHSLPPSLTQQTTCRWVSASRMDTSNDRRFAMASKK